MSFDLFLVGIVQGLILALVVYAIMIPFRLLNFPDLTVEGSYPLSGAICAACLQYNISPFICIFFGILGAGLMSVATASIYLRFKVNSLLAGIILTTMGYSVILRILGKPNISLFGRITLLDPMNIEANIFVIVMIILCCVLPLAMFLYTDYGLNLRAVGLNPIFAKKQKININFYTILGLFLAGSFSGLAGGLMVQLQNYMDVGMGVGIVIHGLASLMIGEAVVGKNDLKKQLIAPLIGALLYQQIQGMVLSFGLAPSDLKFFTGGVVLLVIALQQDK